MIVLIAGFCSGLYRGFFKELAGTVGLFVAAVLTNILSPHVKPLLSGLISEPTVLSVTVWILLFLALMILMGWIATLLSKLFSAVMLGWLNRLMGGFLALIKYALISALVVWIVGFIVKHLTIPDLAAQLAASKLVPVLNQVVDMCCSLIS
ncbi:MAG: CvpA family protein [Bacteroidales bacterium]|nr:CvpA family protein [Candidatus Liminaster caballi]